MERKLLILTILFASSLMYSQKDSEDNDFEDLENHLYKTEIIEVDSLDQTELQAKSKKSLRDYL